ncbi:unnamed protein product [Pylaiella littoralis]
MRLTLPLLCCATFGAAFVPRGGIVTNVTPSASRCGPPGGRHASRYRVPGESYWRASSGFGLDWAVSHEVRVHGDGDGSGSISPATPPPSAIAATEAKIDAVARDIKALENETQDVKAALSGGPAYLGITDGNFLLKQLEQLREKEKQLREKKLLLLKPAAAAVSPSGKLFRSGWWSPDLAKGAGDADTEVGGSKDLLEQAQAGQRQQEGGVKERQGREESRSPQHTRRGQSFISARVTASTAAADSAVNHEAQLRIWPSRAFSRWPVHVGGKGCPPGSPREQRA